MPPFPQGPFVDAAASLVPGKGVLLCGGFVGSVDNPMPTNKCYFMDFERNSLGEEMFTSFPGFV